MGIRVSILDDHISIIDGYKYRLSRTPEIEVVATGTCGEDLEPMLADHGTDVLLLDINVPTSPENPNPFPILHLIPRLLERYPGLSILVISMLNQPTLIEAVAEAGVSGYILKDDQPSIEQLGRIVARVAGGGVFFSPDTHRGALVPGEKPVLTSRQLEALYLCASYPDGATLSLARKLGISGSTMRNLLSGAYTRLGVGTRAAAIARATQLGLIPAPQPTARPKK